MRVTISLDDDVVEAARSLARARSITLGSAISLLARQGLSSENGTQAAPCLPQFEVKLGARPITLEDVKHAEDEV